MSSRSAAVLGLLASLALSTSFWAKGAPVMIELTGANLASPIRITAPKLLREFTPLDGPGNNNVALKDAEKGSIIDWKAGIVEQPPAGPPRYEVSLTEDYGVVCYSPSDCARWKPQIVYVVFYEYDPSSRRGFVYMPGKGDPWHARNISTLYRPEAEGHWFLATDSWTGLVRRLLANAQGGGRQHAAATASNRPPSKP